MNLKTGLLLFTMVLAPALPAHALDETKAADVMQKAVDLFIRPGYHDFRTKAEALSTATDTFCGAPSEAGLKTLAGAFTTVVTAWGHIEIVQSGPVMDENRFDRVLFYPDRKGMGLKQVQSLLATPQDDATDAAHLKDKSVAIQGLSAYEFVFFGSYPESVVHDKNNFRCRYGAAIAHNIASIAGEVDDAWSKPGGIADQWKKPSATNKVFRTGQEAITALIGIHVHGLETVRDQRIKQFYKGKGEKALPKQALFWRSGNTAAVLSANVDGLMTLWETADPGVFLPDDSRSLSSSVLFDYKTVRGGLSRLDPPTAENLGEAKYVARLDFIELTLKDTIQRIDNDIAASIGLGASFSFSDGD
jgi:hypothetical protein